MFDLNSEITKNFLVGMLYLYFDTSFSEDALPLFWYQTLIG